MNVRALFYKPTLMAGLSLWLILIIGFAVYSNGIAPGFLFDDFVNINALGNSGTINSWQEVWQYVLSANGSATGRPLSVASFLLNDNSWPSSAESFKYTNVLLHLLCGTLLTWLLYNIGLSLSFSSRYAAYTAIAGAAIWMLHPLQVSTVLYPVQRMAIMSALFVIAGLGLYVKGRLQLFDREYGKSALLYMVLGIGLCTPLAVLSKENGALLPLLALVLNITVLKNIQPLEKHKQRLLDWFNIIFIWLPLALMIMYFILVWDTKILDQYAVRRPFGLYERLITEPRILLDYLGKLFLPSMQSAGLYHDSYPYSRGLLDPPSTLLAISLVVGAIVFAYIKRNRLPIISCGILFFFAAHILESSFIPLELYFEHRNYLPSILLFYPIVCLVAATGFKSSNARFIKIVSVMAVAVLLAMTFLRVNLWSDIERLTLVWAEENPGSMRTQQQAVIIWNKLGKKDKALHHMERAIENSPNDSMLRLQKLSLHCGSGKQIDQSSIGKAIEKSKNDVIDTYTGKTVERIIDFKRQGYCPEIEYGVLIDFLQISLDNTQVLNFPSRRQHINYLLGRICLELKDYEKAEKYFKASYEASPESIEAGIQIVALLSSYSRYDAALELLEDVEKKYLSSYGAIPSSKKQILYKLRNFESEINRLRNQIKKDIKGDV